MSVISKKIKQFRLSSGLTQEQLASELGVTRQALSNWEHDKTQPDLEMLKRISNVLQVDVRELIYEETEIQVYEEAEIQGEEIAAQEPQVSIETEMAQIPLKNEKGRKQGSDVKKIILITIGAVCLFFGIIVACLFPFVSYLRIKSFKQHTSSEESSKELTEVACLLDIPEEKPKEDSNAKAVDSETVRWFNTGMAIWLRANHLDLELYGGYEKDDMSLSDAQYRLSNDWNIGSRQDTYETLLWLLGEGHRSEYEEYKNRLLEKELLGKGERVFLEQLPKAIPEVSDNQELNRFTTVYRANKEYKELGIDAWDYCRALQVVSSAYYAGYYSLSEALQQSLLIGEELQSEYSSWETVCGSYLYGYVFWQKEDSENMYGPSAARRMIYEDLLEEADNPYAANDFNQELRDTWSNAGLVMESGDYTYGMQTTFEDMTEEGDRGYKDIYHYKGDGSREYSSNVVIRHDWYYPEEDDYMSEDAFVKCLEEGGYLMSFGDVWKGDTDEKVTTSGGGLCYSLSCHDEEWKENEAVRTVHIIRTEGKDALLFIVETYYETDNIADWKQEVQQIIDSVRYVEEE